METAIKLSRAYFKRVGEPGRIKFISRRDSYHGATAGAMALGGNHLYPRVDYEPLMPGTYHAPQPNFYRCEFGSETPEECGERSVKAIEDIIKFQGPETVAGVIAEPISSPMGRGCAPRQLLAAAAGSVRQVRRAAHCRRGDHRVRPHRQDVSHRSTGV